MCFPSIRAGKQGKRLPRRLRAISCAKRLRTSDLTFSLIGKEQTTPFTGVERGCARFLIRLRVAVLNGPRLTAGPFKFAFRISPQFLSYFAGCPLTPGFQQKKEVYTLLLWTIRIFNKALLMAVVHCHPWTCLPVVSYQPLLMVVGTWAAHAQVQVAIGILCPRWRGPIQRPHRGPLAE